MSMNTGVSGLNAASESLNTISNNIANANTTGYKSMDAQFADVYSSTGGGGVYVAAVETNFAQGDLLYTTSATDLAIEGDGFFIMEDANGQQYYTRAGNFSTDKDGYLVNHQGQKLMGFAVDENGNVIEGQLVELAVDTADQGAQATNQVDLTANLDARAEVPGVDFDPENPESYNSTTTTTVYDSLGNEQQLTAYYVKNEADGEWTVHYEMDGEPVGEPQTMQFDENGQLVSEGTITVEGIDINVSSFSQYASDFSVTTNTQDGYGPGSFLGITISDEGAIVATYSNGQSRIQGYVALASFPNNGGLAAAGNTSWTETPESGDAIIGLPGSGSRGTLTGSALENSNVNMSGELVDMIVAQSAYQANTKTISTANENTRYLLNAF
ncbi:flagellar hook protein FlgE [Endozoicomonas lisbonensis]|uniref:Flagellar hook protein FlgE n=1 Tax=Endozoicomonas lisbonensis TaxID=3120522 RepID=A0ABV2SBK6_9GAMM